MSSENEIRFGGKDIIERLHGPEIIQQLQQENQALRKDLEHLKKAEIAFREIISQQDYLAIARNSELTRLREALKEIAEAKFSNLGELLKVPEIAREALAPQGTETH